MIRPSDRPVNPRSDISDIHIGLVTALPVEYAALETFLDAVSDQTARQDPHYYRSGSLPSKDPARPHHVVVALQTRDGTQGAASLCTDMVRSFPHLRVLIMCGIAGGIPRPGDPLRDVRLGDVVVATGGIVDYGHVRRVEGIDSLRRPVSGISAMLVRADRELQVMALGGNEPWHAHLEAAAIRHDRFRRPPAQADPLHSVWPVVRADGAGPGLTKPQDGVRRPRIWRGALGSSDILVRDAAFRDRLASDHDVIAVEMEGAGIAAVAESNDRHWFEVRGVSDYCDNRTKNDVWHDYAAVAASAYIRSLLAVCLPIGSQAIAAGASVHGFQAIVDALLTLPVITDDYQRRAVLAQLPGEIRAAVPDSVTARIHIVGLIRTCERIPGGRDALLEALRLALGSTTADYTRVETVIRQNWLDSS